MRTREIINENSFSEIAASSLKDYSWDENENIHIFDIFLSKKELGFVGSVIVAILESAGKPVVRIELNSRDVEIERTMYTLERRLELSEDSIKEISKSISINDNGDIKETNPTIEHVRSKSKISLHGIEIPTSLFPYTWEMKNNQVRITWPFSLLLVVDICGKRDLDLNSSRTEIIMSEKWLDFEEDLKESFIATKVKLNDLRHNMDISQIPNPTEKDMERMKRYRREYWQTVEYLGPVTWKWNDDEI